MLVRFVVAAVVAAVAVVAVLSFSATQEPAAAWLCTKKGEVISGIKKICIYHCPLGDAAITISAASLCPISINQ